MVVYKFQDLVILALFITIIATGCSRNVVSEEQLNNEIITQLGKEVQNEIEDKVSIKVRVAEYPLCIIKTEMINGEVRIELVTAVLNEAGFTPEFVVLHGPVHLEK